MFTDREQCEDPSTASYTQEQDRALKFSSHRTSERTPRPFSSNRDHQMNLDEDEYWVEAPKSGLNHCHEVLTSLFLPSHCESSVVPCPTLSSTARSSVEEARELVYCDDSEWCSATVTSCNSRWGLKFDSKFECGNLMMVESVMRNDAAFGDAEEYDLYIRSDPCTESGPVMLGQWFMFRVQETKQRSYRFNIHNFSQADSPYRAGMKPLALSQARLKDRGEGWYRIGEDLSYEPSTRSPLTSPPTHSYSVHPELHPRYTLSFMFHCEHAKDCMYFAFAPPYGLTQLQNTVNVLTKDPQVKPHVKVRTVCRSPAGNRCDMVVITENGSLVHEHVSLEQLNEDSALSEQSTEGAAFNVDMFKYSLADVLTATAAVEVGICADIPNDNKEDVGGASDEAANGRQELPRFLRKLEVDMQVEQHVGYKRKLTKVRKMAVVITARAHGMDTASSWMCEGLMKFLTSCESEAAELRSKFVFYVLPMMNPDGVVNGFSRSDLLGRDINLHWHDTCATTSVQQYVKQLVETLNKTTNVAAVIDLRGSILHDGAFCSALSKRQYDRERRLPSSGPNDVDPRRLFLALARRSCLFSLAHCSLKMGHKSTSMAAFFAKVARIPLSLALTVSVFQRPAGAKFSTKHLSPTDYAKVGVDLCIALGEVYSERSSAKSVVGDRIGQTPHTPRRPLSCTSATEKCRESRASSILIGASSIQQAHLQPFMHLGEAEYYPIETTGSIKREEVNVAADGDAHGSDVSEQFMWEAQDACSDTDCPLVASPSSAQTPFRPPITIVRALRRAFILGLSVGGSNVAAELLSSQTEKVYRLGAGVASFTPISIVQPKVPPVACAQVANGEGRRRCNPFRTIDAELSRRSGLSTISNSSADMFSKVKQLVTASSTAPGGDALDLSADRRHSRVSVETKERARVRKQSAWQRRASTLPVGEPHNKAAQSAVHPAVGERTDMLDRVRSSLHVNTSPEHLHGRTTVHLQPAAAVDPFASIRNGVILTQQDVAFVGDRDASAPLTTEGHLGDGDVGEDGDLSVAPDTSRATVPSQSGEVNLSPILVMDDETEDEGHEASEEEGVAVHREVEVVGRAPPTPTAKSDATQPCASDAEKDGDPRQQVFEHFLEQMGLDYGYLYGGAGFVRAPDSIYSLIAGEDGKIAHSRRIAPDGTYYRGFPQRVPHVGPRSDGHFIGKALLSHQLSPYHKSPSPGSEHTKPLRMTSPRARAQQSSGASSGESADGYTVREIREARFQTCLNRLYAQQERVPLWVPNELRQYLCPEPSAPSAPEWMQAMAGIARTCHDRKEDDEPAFGVEAVANSSARAGPQLPSSTHRPETEEAPAAQSVPPAKAVRTVTLSLFGSVENSGNISSVLKAERTSAPHRVVQHGSHSVLGRAVVYAVGPQLFSLPGPPHAESPSSPCGSSPSRMERVDSEDSAYVTYGQIYRSHIQHGLDLDKLSLSRGGSTPRQALRLPSRPLSLHEEGEGEQEMEELRQVGATAQEEDASKLCWPYSFYRDRSVCFEPTSSDSPRPLVSAPTCTALSKAKSHHKGNAHRPAHKSRPKRSTVSVVAPQLDAFGPVPALSPVRPSQPKPSRGSTPQHRATGAPAPSSSNKTQLSAH